MQCAEVVMFCQLVLYSTYTLQCLNVIALHTNIKPRGKQIRLDFLPCQKGVQKKKKKPLGVQQLITGRQVCTFFLDLKGTW